MESAEGEMEGAESSPLGHARPGRGAPVAAGPLSSSQVPTNLPGEQSGSLCRALEASIERVCSPGHRRETRLLRSPLWLGGWRSGRRQSSRRNAASCAPRGLANVGAWLLAVFLVPTAQAAIAVPGSTIRVDVRIDTNDPNEIGEPNEYVVITSTGGFVKTLPLTPSSTTIFFTARLRGERVKVRLIGDGDESMTYSVSGADDPNPGRDRGANAGDQGCPTMTGQPINTATGNKFRIGADYRGVGENSLKFYRYYNSDDFLTDLWNLFSYPFFSRAWLHTYSSSIFDTSSQNGGPATQVRLLRPDGQSFAYTSDGNGNWTSAADRLGRLGATADGGWVYSPGNNTLEYYPTGAGAWSVTAIANAGGYIRYWDGRTASDSYGRTIEVNPSGTNGVSTRSVRLPDGSGMVYDYAPQSDISARPSTVLTTVTFFDAYQPSYQTVTPPGQQLQYLYGEAPNQANGPSSALPALLTGIVDENGARYATFMYDAYGRAYYSSLAGGADKVVVSYGDDDTSTIGDDLGSVGHSFTPINGIEKLTAASQPAGSGCSAAASASAFDASGNLISRDDFNGNRTCYAYDALSRETTRVEGLATSAACTAVLTPNAPLPPGSRKVTQTWHPDWRLVATVAQPKRLTTLVYNGQIDPTTGSIASCAPASATLPAWAGNKPIAVLCKRVVQATLDADGHAGAAVAPDAAAAPAVTTMTYNATGQVLSVTDGANHTTSYTYYGDTSASHTLGDLQSVVNPAGHTRTFPVYDKNGRVLRIVEPSGATTDLTYWPRGWLRSATVTPVEGGVRTTNYIYDAVGQLKQASLPDGTSVSYTYDDAHRLTGVTDGAGNTIAYVLDSKGNRVRETVKDPGGNLARNIGRVYDALNRLQAVTGAPQ